MRSYIGTDLATFIMLFCLWGTSGRSWWQFALIVAIGWCVNVWQATRP